MYYYFYFYSLVYNRKDIYIINILDGKNVVNMIFNNKINVFNFV